MDHIRQGMIPEVMEDKWFIYWKDDALFFHRSWTGFCIYVVRFAADGENKVLKARLCGRKLRLTDDERRRLAVKASCPKIQTNSKTRAPGRRRVHLSL